MKPSYVYMVMCLLTNHNKNCKWVDEKTWEILKKYFPDATEVSKCPRTISCKECSTVPMNEHEDIFDPPTVPEKNFLIIIFSERTN